MLKKLMVSIFALVLGAAAAEAIDLVSLGVYFLGEGSVEVEGTLPKGVSRGKNVKEKSGAVSFPCYINIGKVQAAEMQFKVTGSGKFSVSAYAFSRDSEGNRVIPVLCQKFEIDGKSLSDIPCTIKKWRKMATREVKDGDVITVSVEFEKPEE